MNKSIFLIFFVLLPSQTTWSHEGRYPKIIASKKNSIEITISSEKKVFKLAHDVAGFSVNCSRSRLTTWGTPNIVSNESPQTEKVTTIDLRNRKIIKEFSLGKGVISASYLEDGVSSYIESGYGTVVVSGTGAVRYVELGVEESLPIEKCAFFKGKNYSKWKNGLGSSAK